MRESFEAFDAARDLEGKPFRSLCYAPHVQLSFSPNGDVSACCMSRSHILGNLRVDRLDDIWHGERLRQFRDQLRRYVFPSGCESCYWSLQAGNYLNHAIRGFDAMPLDPTGRWPAQLEFALSNTCNLGCIMCNGEYSSVLRVKEGLPPIAPAYDDQFYEDLARYLPHAKLLSFLGGEPFLQEECHRIWNTLIDMDLAIPCHVTTNGSIYNAQVERFLERLPFNLNISVDGVSKETIERIRVNVKYDSLMANIRRFHAYAVGTADHHSDLRVRQLQLNFCVMQQNCYELADFFLFAESLQAKVWTVLVTYPTHCSLFSLPVTKLETIVTTLDQQTSAIQDQLAVNKDAWTALVGEIRQHLTDRHTPDAVNEAAWENRASAPGELVSHMHRAWHLMKEGKQTEALHAAMQTPRTDPHYFKSLTLIAAVNTLQGDFHSAEVALEEAAQLAPRHPELFVTRAWLRYHQQQFDDGLADLDLATQATSRLGRVEDFIPAQILLARGTLLYHQGAIEQSIEPLDSYLELHPDDGSARRLREDAHRQLGSQTPRQQSPLRGP
jgi:radical SAM protein with 4Fe4S-binding SPASM domain